MNSKSQTHEISQSPLYKLRSRSKLARMLGVSIGELRRLSVGPNRYRERDIPKRSGGSRHIEDPIRPLKIVQARLARLLGLITPPEYLYCPVKRRCYVTNAAQHANNRVVRSLDVKKYFPSTSARRVFWFFLRVMRCERDVAGLLTGIATYEEHLPTGSPLSPIMAFFAHHDVWEAIAAFCKARGYVLTVYVDDCTISGERVPKRDLWVVKQLIHGAGLRYHKEKAFIDRPAEITGVIAFRGQLTPPNRQMKKLRQARTRFEQGERAELVDQIVGLEGQIKQISAANQREPRAAENAEAP